MRYFCHLNGSDFTVLAEPYTSIFIAAIMLSTMYKLMALAFALFLSSVSFSVSHADSWGWSRKETQIKDALHFVAPKQDPAIDLLAKKWTEFRKQRLEGRESRALPKNLDIYYIEGPDSSPKTELAERFASELAPDQMPFSINGANFTSAWGFSNLRSALQRWANRGVRDSINSSQITSNSGVVIILSPGKINSAVYPLLMAAIRRIRDVAVVMVSSQLPPENIAFDAHAANRKGIADNFAIVQLKPEVEWMLKRRTSTEIKLPTCEGTLE